MNPKLILSGVVILGAIGLGVVVGTSAGQNFYTVDQFLTLETMPNRVVKVRGIVVEGTLQEEATTIDFVVRDPAQGSTRTLPVHFDALTARGQRPDTLVDRAEVVLEGRLDEAGVFQAVTIFAKCPSKYEEEEGGGHESYGDGAAATQG